MVCFAVGVVMSVPVSFAMMVGMGMRMGFFGIVAVGVGLSGRSDLYVEMGFFTAYAEEQSAFTGVFRNKVKMKNTVLNLLATV
jgi:hypothetical protein